MKIPEYGMTISTPRWARWPDNENQLTSDGVIERWGTCKNVPYETFSLVAPIKVTENAEIFF